MGDSNVSDIGALPQHIERIARREARLLVEAIERTERLEFPTEGSSVFLCLLKRTVQAIPEEVAKRASEADDLPEDQRETDLLGPLRLLSWFHSLVELVELSSIEGNPGGLVSAFQRLVAMTTNEDVRVIVRPQWLFMYDIVDLTSGWEELGDILQNTFRHSDQLSEDLRREAMKPWVILSYPSSHRTSALFYPLYGHEIAHILDRQAELSSQALEQVATEPLSDFVHRRVEQTLEELRERRSSPDAPPLPQPSAELRKKLEADFQSDLLTQLQYWMAELTADAIATCLFGPAYFFALCEFLQAVGLLGHVGKQHPRGAFRIRQMHDLLCHLGYLKKGQLTDQLRQEIDNWQERADASPAESELCRILEAAIDDVRDHIFEHSQRGVSKLGTVSVPDLCRNARSLADRLAKGLPPVQIVDRKQKQVRYGSIPEAVNAAWEVSLIRIDELGNEFGGSSEDELHSLIDRCLAKAIEVNEIIGQDSEYSLDHQALADSPLRRYLLADNEDEWFDVSPILDPEAQLSGMSVDLRLGNRFVLPHRSRYGEYDPFGQSGRARSIREHQRRMYVPFDRWLVLHPGQFALGTSLEYIRMPPCLQGYVLSRSSWGRVGLTIATATFVNPGFIGCLTLELVNHGEVPLVLRPGVRVAQLVLHPVDNIQKYASRSKAKYAGAIEPEFSKLESDQDRGLLVRKGFIEDGE